MFRPTMITGLALHSLFFINPYWVDLGAARTYSLILLPAPLSFSG